MNNNCEFAGDRCCLCSTCQAVRKAMEDAEKITMEEIEELFSEVEEKMKGCKKLWEE